MVKGKVKVVPGL